MRRIGGLLGQTLKGVTNLSTMSKASEYLHVFKDYSASYRPVIEKHKDYFDKISESFDAELKKVDTSDVTSVRLTYQRHDKEILKVAEQHIEANGISGKATDEVYYVTRLSAQFTTRMVTFKHDPDGVHQIHKVFTRMNRSTERQGKGVIPPLGRTIDNISDPSKTAGKTRSRENMKITLGVDIGDGIKPARPRSDPDFEHHPRKGLKKIVDDEPEKTGPKLN